MIYETEVKVRYVETDQMGIVHHSNYLPWFEVGRTELFNSIGISYGQIEKDGIMLPLIDSYCRYINSSKYEDELIIQTVVEQLKHVKTKVAYSIIRKEDNKLIAIGYTTHVFTDLNLKPINLKKHNLDLYNKLLNCI